MDDTQIASMVYEPRKNEKITRVAVNFSKKWIAKTASSRASDVEIVIYGPEGVQHRILLALVGD